MKKQKGLNLGYKVMFFMLIFLILCTGIIYFSTKDSYKIYKTECTNETIILPENANLFFTKPYYDKIYMKPDVSGNFGYDYEVCQEVEVENINIKIYNVSSYGYCKMIGFESLGIPQNLGRYGCIKIIPKEDINQEWLDGNCDIKYSCPSGCTKLETEYGLMSCIRNEKIIFYGASCEPISEYKCGEYMIRK